MASRNAIGLDAGSFRSGIIMWGWLFVIAAWGIGLFELGAVQRRRDALGLI